MTERNRPKQHVEYVRSSTGSKNTPPPPGNSRSVKFCCGLLRLATYGCSTVAARFVPICHDQGSSRQINVYDSRFVTFHRGTSRCATVYQYFCYGRTWCTRRWQKKYETSTPVEKLHSSACVRVCVFTAILLPYTQYVN